VSHLVSLPKGTYIHFEKTLSSLKFHNVATNILIILLLLLSHSWNDIAQQPPVCQVHVLRVSEIELNGRMIRLMLISDPIRYPNCSWDLAKTAPPVPQLNNLNSASQLQQQQANSATTTTPQTPKSNSMYDLASAAAMGSSPKPAAAAKQGGPLDASSNMNLDEAAHDDDAEEKEVASIIQQKKQAAAAAANNGAGNNKTATTASQQQNGNGSNANAASAPKPLTASINKLLSMHNVPSSLFPDAPSDSASDFATTPVKSQSQQQQQQPTSYNSSGSATPLSTSPSSGNNSAAATGNQSSSGAAATGADAAKKASNVKAQQFSFKDFVEKMKHKNAAALVKKMKQFFDDTDKAEYNDEVPHRVRDFLVRMMQEIKANVLWKNASEQEFETSSESLEKYVMTRIHAKFVPKTFFLQLSFLTKFFKNIQKHKKQSFQSHRGRPAKGPWVASKTIFV